MLAILAAGGLGGEVPPAPRDSADAATAPPPVWVPIRGRLSAEARAELERVRPGPSGALIAFVRQDDVFTCEDLGRQLRELSHSLGGGSRLVIWTETRGTGRVTAYLKREKVRHHLLVTANLSRLLEQGSLPATPSAVIVGAEGQIRGVAHPRRTANVRVLSFAHELAPLAREGSGTN